MRRSFMSGGVLVAALLLSALSVLAMPGGSSAQGGVAVMSVSPPSQTVQSTAPSVEVTVRLTGGVGIGAWEFGLEYDPAVLELTTLTPGPFLASINQQCFRNDYPTHDGLVAVQYGCGGFGQYTEMSGDGVLATLTMTPKGTGTVDLIFTKRELATRIGDGIAVTSADGIVKVIAPGSSDTGLEPTPTANPVRLTPTALPPTEIEPYILPSGSAQATPTSVSGVLPGAADDSGASGWSPGSGAPGGSGSVAGAGSAAGGGGSAASGARGDFPVAGSGPEDRSPDPTGLYVGAAALAVGAMLVTAGRRWRTRVRSS